MNPRPIAALVNPRAGHPGEQSRAVVAWAAGEGLTVARTVDASPESISLVCEDIRTGILGGMAAARLDVLGDLVAQEVLRAVLARFGGTLHIADQGDAAELAAPPAQDVRNLLRLFEERYTRMVGAAQGVRLVGAREKAKAEGRRVGGRTPYGKAVVAGQVVDDARELAIITRIETLWERLHSYSAVARQLEAEGYLRRDGSTKWYPAVVRRILLREEEPSS